MHRDRERQDREADRQQCLLGNAPAGCSLVCVSRLDPRAECVIPGAQALNQRLLRPDAGHRHTQVGRNAAIRAGATDRARPRSHRPVRPTRSGRPRFEPRATPPRRRFVRLRGRCVERAAPPVAPRDREAPRASTRRTRDGRIPRSGGFHCSSLRRLSQCSGAATGFGDSVPGRFAAHSGLRASPTLSPRRRPRPGSGPSPSRAAR